MYTDKNESCSIILYSLRLSLSRISVIIRLKQENRVREHFAKLKSANLKLAGIVLGTLASGVVGIGVMMATTPKHLGPSGVTFWFIDALIFVVGCLCIALITVKIWLLHGRDNLNRTVNSSFRTAFLTGLGLMTILALRSLGTLSIKDIVLLALVLLLIEFYLRTRGHQEAYNGKD